MTCLGILEEGGGGFFPPTLDDYVCACVSEDEIQKKDDDGFSAGSSRGTHEVPCQTLTSKNDI